MGSSYKDCWCLNMASLFIQQLACTCLIIYNVNPLNCFKWLGPSAVGLTVLYRKQSGEGQKGRLWEKSGPALSPVVSSRNLGTQTHRLQSRHCCHSDHHLEKTRKYLVFAVNPWPPSSRSGGIAPSRLPDPSESPLHRPQPGTPHGLLRDWSRNCSLLPITHKAKAATWELIFSQS